MSDRGGYIIKDQFATHFITFTLVGWVDIFSRKECRGIIIDSLKYCQENKGLIINAYVIMSSHIHMIIAAREDSDGLSAIIRDLKKYTAKELLKWILESKIESRKEWLKVVLKYHAKFNTNNKEYQVWQRDNHPEICLHPRFTAQKLNYIHNNPVAAAIVTKPEDYLYSSARNYLNLDNTLIDVEVIDFGIEEGYIMT